MAALTQANTPKLASIAFIKKRDAFIEKIVPRPCMVVSVGLILAGWGIPLLMVVQLLPATLIFGFVGFALVATDGVLTLVFYGEV